MPGEGIAAAAIGGASNVAGGVIGLIGQRKREERAWERAQAAMRMETHNQGLLMQQQAANEARFIDTQFRNQQALNQQGADLQYDMWKKTNYPAQMEMLREAGLNPALLYGMKGGGGVTTGSQGGGSAAKGNAAGGSASALNSPMHPFDLGNIIAGSGKMLAEIALIKAQQKKVEADTKVVESTGITEAQTRIQKMMAETENTELKSALQQIENRIAEFNEAYTVPELDARLKKVLEEAESIKLQNKMTEETWEDVRFDIAQTALGKQIEIEAKQKNMELQEAEIKKMSADITQRYIELAQKVEGLSQKDREINIQEFEASVKAEYPTAWQVLGAGLQHSVDLLTDVFTWKNPFERDYNTPTTSRYKPK